jgi:hypothetical protein
MAGAHCCAAWSFENSIQIQAASGCGMAKCGWLAYWRASQGRSCRSIAESQVRKQEVHTAIRDQTSSTIDIALADDHASKRTDDSDAAES